MKYWEVRMKADRVGELLLYGPIASTQFWGDEVSPKQIDADLKALGELDTLNVRINSPGGSVFAGQAIFNIIQRHPAPTKCAYIDGLAASMASVIPLACGRVIMPVNALIMIHKPRMAVSGTADEIRKGADLVDKVEGQMVDIYCGKCGEEPEKMKELLAAETWLTAQEALDLGLIDEIEKDMRVAASLDGDFLIFGDVKADIKDFKNFNPEMYRAAFETPEPVADKDPVPDPLDVMAEQSQDFHRIREKIYKTYEEDN